jgi:hypothetical protein
MARELVQSGGAMSQAQQGPDGQLAGDGRRATGVGHRVTDQPLRRDSSGVYRDDSDQALFYT